MNKLYYEHPVSDLIVLSGPTILAAGSLTKAGKYKIELTLSGVSEKIVTHILVR